MNKEDASARMPNSLTQAGAFHAANSTAISKIVMILIKIGPPLTK